MRSVVEFCTFQREMFTGSHFLSGFSRLIHWNLLFCMTGFEVYQDVTAALNSHVTKTDRFLKDFYIANTPDSTVQQPVRWLIQLFRPYW